MALIRTANGKLVEGVLIKERSCLVNYETETIKILRSLDIPLDSTGISVRGKNAYGDRRNNWFAVWHTFSKANPKWQQKLKNAGLEIKYHVCLSSVYGWESYIIYPKYK